MNQAPELSLAEQQAAELRAANEHLRGALSLLHSTLESTADGILVVDPDGKITGFNQQFVKMWRIPQSVIAAQDDTLALAFVLDQLKDAETFLRKVHELYSKPEAESFDVLEFKDGRIFERYSRPRRIEQECNGRVWSFRDVTAQRMAEQLAQRQSDILEMVARNLPLKDLLSHVAYMVESQITGCRCCVLHLSGGHLIVGATPNLPQAFALDLEGLSLGAELIAATEVARADAWLSYRTLAQNHGLLLSGSTPFLSSSDELMGFVIVHHRTAGAQIANLENLLSTAGKLAALAVDHAALARRLSYQAQYDALTGLPNRALFQDRLRQAIHHARRHQQIIAVLFMDLNGFKRVNDTLGHRAGDKLLKEVAARFQQGMRHTDTLARHGGDEFMLVLNDIRHYEGAARIAQFLLTSLDEPFDVEGHEIRLTASIGISLYPNDGEEEEILERHADAAMYKAKTAGHNSFECFTPELNAQLVDRIELEDQLCHAISREQMLLHFQPQHHADGNVLGFEALLRWAHPVRGMIAPDRFIPIAEESGLILPIGRWTLEESCRQCAAWRTAGHRDMHVSVNVSATQFEHPAWVAMVAEVLAQTGLESAALELELTERLVMRHTVQSIKCLQALKMMGVSIAIDDFGTGHSSLAYLQQLPIDRLKIDRTFINGLASESADRSSSAIVEAIVKLAMGLGLQVMAEGVETAAQLEFLRRVGCDAMQGYYYAQPMLVKDCDAYLARGGEAHSSR